MERLHGLVTKGLIDLDEIDDLLGWRLESLAGNEIVRAFLDHFP